MRRSPWHRLASALLAVWFALVLVEPAVLHACPVHSGHGKAAQRGAMDHASHAGHQADHQADHQAGPDAPAPSAAHVCTCVGDCAGGIVASAPEGHVVLVALTRLTTVAPGRPQHEYVAAWVDFVLPFANAPPALAA